MKILALLFTLTLSLYANLKLLDSFEADFTQSVTDEKGKKLVYKGTLKAQRPNMALWSYTSPIQKSVYIKEGLVSIVEPELEQVVVRKIQNDFDFFTILSRAKKVTSTHYTAAFEDQKIEIYLKNEEVTAIEYKDKLENSVRIEFSKQEKNRILSPVIFDATFPSHFDLIEE